MKKTIPIESIAQSDKTYCMSYFFDVTVLQESLQAVGQIQPIWVEKRPDGQFRVVSGFRRLEAARLLGWQTLVVEILPAKADWQLERYKRVLFENLALRPFNWVEKATIIQRLGHLFGVSEESLVRDWFPVLKIGSNRKWLTWLAAITDYEPEVQEAIARDALTFDLFEFLPALDSESRVLLTRLFRTLNLGKNRQKEFFTLLRDVALREELSLAEVLKKEEIQTIWKRDSHSLGQKTQEVRTVLRRWRYPYFSKTDERFRQIVRDLRLPPVVQLRPPPNFEGEKFRLEFSFRTEEDFAEIVSKLQDVVASGKLQALGRLWEEI